MPGVSSRLPASPLAGVAMLLATLATLPGDATPEPRGPRAAWVYDLPDLPDGAVGPALDRLAARGVTRLFLSVEDGHRFRLDAPEERAAVAGVVAAAARRGLAVEATLLQDPRWLDDRAGALRRVAAAAEFGRTPGERPFDGLHLDVEPHTEEAWECGGEAGRSRLVDRLTELAREARRTASSVRGSALPISVAVPWWTLDDAAPGGPSAARALAAAADEIVLMAYGEPGGPVVGGDADRLVCRLGLPGRLDTLPPGTRLTVGLAGYEYPDAAALAAAANRLDARLDASPRYGGSALFLDAAPPGTPLAVVIRGRVVGAGGRPLRGAAVTATPSGGGDPAVSTANACGRFVVRLGRPGEASLAAEAGGARAEVTLTGLLAGREREIGAVVVPGPAGAHAAPPGPDPALPPYADALAHARALAAAGDHDRAEAVYASILARWPGMLEARLGLARLDAWRGRRDRAAWAYTSVLAGRCDAAEALLGLGDLARWDGRLDEAARRYRTVADGWPHEPAGHLGLARVALDRGRPAEALPLVERALALDPSDADARALLTRAAPGPRP